MNEDFLLAANMKYPKAEEKAIAYFKALHTQLQEKNYVSTLTNDIHIWKKHHIHYRWNGRRKSKTKHYRHYIEWLNFTGKLDNYLQRSISYLYLRDLGKPLDNEKTQTKIQEAVASVKKRLLSDDKSEFFNMATLYRWSQKYGIESTIIWLFEKLTIVSSNIPVGMDKEHAKRKLIKLIAGVVMHEFEEIDDNLSEQDRQLRLDKAIRLGYCYGLTYPFIDDLLDANVLTEAEKQQYTKIIRISLITGNVPQLGEWVGPNKQLIEFVHQELKAAFEYIKANLSSETHTQFFEQAYIFFHSQEIDREKDLDNEQYTNEDIYVPIILKSAYSRLIARTVLSPETDEGFNNRTFYYGIYNQLADDFADMFDDMEEGAVTPYTYYWKYHKKRKDLLNPFELYWTVICNLIHHIYQSDPNTREVILARAINGIKRFKEKCGKEQYKEVMGIFAPSNSKFNNLIQKVVRQADDVDFFDKLLRDEMIANLRKEQKEQDEFTANMETIRIQLNNVLPIPKNEQTLLLEEPLMDAVNYSLEGDGKRIRPFVAWMMAKQYGLNESAVLPLLKSLEYMHTASLIFDDLPSQDNAEIRRGRPTLHHIYNSAIAELTGLFLTQKAIEEQISLNGFDAKFVLRLIQYSAQKTMEMCKGQALDLESKGKKLTLEQLNLMCFYKTGIAFEASIIMPLILVNEKPSHIEMFKKFAYHAGIAFQIKDDLLDEEGDVEVLGKPIQQDLDNNSSTFVTVLGVDGAKKEMWDHYCLAMETLHQVPQQYGFLKYLLDYMVNRNQ
ncbi:polyprenyl synthetase family protein [Lederbergia graminis]|uniref:Polyprenyl synthetase family protein n=1 Tax=Lederbergia graminis TaxID=735518 RepID=A0ABW0LI59_9BACI